MIFGTAVYGSGIKIKKSNMADAEWYSCNIAKFENVLNFFKFRNTTIFRVAEHECEVKSYLFRIIDLKF